MKIIESGKAILKRRRPLGKLISRLGPFVIALLRDLLKLFRNQLTGGHHYHGYLNPQTCFSDMIKKMLSGRDRFRRDGSVTLPLSDRSRRLVNKDPIDITNQYRVIDCHNYNSSLLSLVSPLYFLITVDPSSSLAIDSCLGNTVPQGDAIAQHNLIPGWPVQVK